LDSALRASARSRAVLPRGLHREALAADRAQLPDDVGRPAGDVEFERRVGQLRERRTRGNPRAVARGQCGDLPARDRGHEHGAQWRDLRAQRHEIAERRARHVARPDRGRIDRQRVRPRHQQPQRRPRREHHQRDYAAHDLPAPRGMRALDPPIHRGAGIGQGRLRHADTVPDRAATA